MKKNWLRDRLTPSKQGSALWRDLANAIQVVIDKHVSPIQLRLKNRISLFFMHKDDINTVLHELGAFFAIGKSEPDDLPLLIMQRQDEVHQKRTIYPLINTLNREFSGMQVTWDPLYAPTDMTNFPYGSLFLIKKDTGQYPADFKWFLTSRGQLSAPLLDVLSLPQRTNGNVNDAINNFSDELKRIVYPLFPLRIVCHGLALHTKQSKTIHTASIMKVIHYIKIGPKPLPMKITINAPCDIAVISCVASDAIIEIQK